MFLIINQAPVLNEPDWVKEDNNSKLDETKSDLDKAKVNGRATRKPRRSKTKGSKKESNGNSAITAGKLFRSFIPLSYELMTVN